MLQNESSQPNIFPQTELLETIAELLETTAELLETTTELLETIERSWWRRGAAVVALLFLLNTFTVTGLWLVGLADVLPAGFISGASFVSAFFLAAIDGAMEKDK